MAAFWWKWRHYSRKLKIGQETYKIGWCRLAALLVAPDATLFLRLVFAKGNGDTAQRRAIDGAFPHPLKVSP
ncbi:MAG: hypothetical protein V4508_14290 [Pseudomonadota bacterium]